MIRRPPARLLRGPAGELPLAELGVGEWRVCRGAAVLSTLLGSCVAACVFDEAAQVGGMNHILLAGRAGTGRAASQAARYAHDAVELLLEELLRRGARRGRLRAKVFGGAHVIRGMSAAGSPAARNVADILDLLAAGGVPVVRADLGGPTGRRIWFRTDTGEVLVRRVGPPRAAGNRPR